MKIKLEYYKNDIWYMFYTLYQISTQFLVQISLRYVSENKKEK